MEEEFSCEADDKYIRFGDGVDRTNGSHLGGRS